MSTVDLNADVGESYGRWSLGDDARLLEIVTSANVACGFHAGDPTTIATTCAAAVARGVAIGAQVAYQDLAGFGRRFIDVDPHHLTDDVIYQIGALRALATVAGGSVSYVKPHGALYNTTVRHEEQARAVVEAVVAYDPSLAVVGLPGSRLLALADDAGLRTIAEVFADRAYRPDGTLVPRAEPGAVILDPAKVAARAVTMVSDGTIIATDGTEVAVEARSVCVHGDTPGAVEIAASVREALRARGVVIEAFG